MKEKPLETYKVGVKLEDGIEYIIGVTELIGKEIFSGKPYRGFYVFDRAIIGGKEHTFCNSTDFGEIDQKEVEEVYTSNFQEIKEKIGKKLRNGEVDELLEPYVKAMFFILDKPISNWDRLRVFVNFGSGVGKQYITDLGKAADKEIREKQKK